MQKTRKYVLVAGIMSFAVLPCIANEMSDACMMPAESPKMAEEMSAVASMNESMMLEESMMKRSEATEEDMLQPDEMRMMVEDMETLLNSLVVLVDIDFHKKMLVIDVDFYKDDANMIETLLMRYAYNPELAEMMLNNVAERYMNEQGDAVVNSLLKNFKIADAELLTHMIRPFVQKAFMSELLNVMHRCIIHKCAKLQEMKAQ